MANESMTTGMKRARSPLALFFVLFLTGFSLLLVFHFVFISLIGKLDQLAENERSRMAIGKMIVSELQQLEIKYYQLPTTNDHRFRTILLTEIEHHLKKVNEALAVIEEGGSIQEVVPLNLPESDKLTYIIEYQPINTERYNLAILELRPELHTIQDLIEEITQMALRRDQLFKKGELDSWKSMIRALKGQIKNNAPRFLRMTEHADRLLYESQHRLQILEIMVTKEKKLYFLQEAVLAVLTIAVILILVVMISRRFMESERNLLEKMTELKNSRQALSLAHNRIAHILDGLDAVVYVADVKSREILFVNRFTYDHFGDVVGKKCYEVFQEPGSEICPYCAFQTEEEAGKYINRIVWEYQSDGCWLEAHGQQIRWDRGEQVFLVILLDISDRKHAEQKRDEVTDQLHQTQKMEAIGTLAGGIAHDFNNILSAILGYTEICQLKVEADSEVSSFLSHVISAGLRAKDLVEQILAFSRRSDAEFSPMELAPIINEGIKLLRASLPTTIDIQCRAECTHNCIMADTVQIHQVIMNMGTNALYAMHENGGTLTIELSSVDLDEQAARDFFTEFKPGLYEKLVINDTGCGMDAETVKRIFDPFFTTKQKRKGTGLGLSIAHGIIQSCGGAIRIISEFGKGTTFTILFPVCPCTPKCTDDVEEKQVATGTERILFVDDEEAVVGVVIKLLEHYGYMVTGQTDSVQALELFREDPSSFDMVITDYTMPRMTGKDLTLALLEIRPDLPIIICTGYSEKLDKQSAREFGVRDFLMKPVAARLLTSTIRRIFDRELA